MDTKAYIKRRETTRVLKCPCENCMCIPICRNKQYMNLFKDCSLLREFLPNYEIANFFSFTEEGRKRIKLIIHILKPTTWKENQPEKEDYAVALFLNAEWTLKS